MGQWQEEEGALRYVASLYRFFPIHDPEAYAGHLRERWGRVGVLGRAYVAHEGFNATLWASAEELDRLIAALNAPVGGDPVRSHRALASKAPFRHLRVRVRPTIVNLGLDGRDVVPHEEGSEHLSPAQFAEEVASGDAVVLDVRNGYEARVGHFVGAIASPYERFHEFERWVEELALPKEARILTYCTGGIRCEKFTGLLARHGYRNVGQLDGGILRYLDEVGADLFRGEVVVFDDRVSVMGGAGPAETATCDRCGAPEAVLVNCANADCHKRILLCSACIETAHGTCSDACLHAPRLRPIRSIGSTRRVFRSLGLELGSERLAEAAEPPSPGVGSRSAR
jgi:UPF0176 protein